MKWLRWYRWTVIVVGRESGNRSTPLTFVRFRRRRQAVEWCVTANASMAHANDLTYFEAVPMP